MKTSAYEYLERERNGGHPMWDDVEHVDLNGRYGFFGETALHCYAIRGDQDACKALIESGADPNLPGEHDYTPLHEAVHGGHTEIVKLLLEAGGDPTLTTEMGSTDFLAQDYPEVQRLLKQKKDGEQAVDGNPH